MQVSFSNYLPFGHMISGEKLRDLAWLQMRPIESDVVALRVALQMADIPGQSGAIRADVQVRIKTGPLRELFTGEGHSIEIALTKALVKVREAVLKVVPNSDLSFDLERDDDTARPMTSPYRGK